MGRDFLRYLPANLVPAGTAVLMVVIYTRLLTPVEYGRFNLAMSTVLIVQSTGFFALAFGTARLLPAAARAGRRAAFQRTAWRDFALMAVVTAALALVAALGLMAFGADPAWAGLLLPVLLLRATVAQSQAATRARDAARRYNIIESAHALLGLGAGAALLVLWGPTAWHALAGLMLAAAICAASDWRRLRAGFSPGKLDAVGGAGLRRFALPLSANYAVNCVMQYSDRFLLDAFLGAGAVGPYAVAWSLVERPTSLLAMAVSLAGFQGAVQALEHEGVAPARARLAQNGLALLALLLPACAGLALTAGPIATVLAGPAFHNDVAALIPVMAVTALLRCASLHFIDHSFHLARRSGLMLAVYAPAAVGTVALDALLVPYFGPAGAAWGGLVGNAGALIAGIVVTRRVLPLTLPWGGVLRVALATAAMAAVLAGLRQVPGWNGLVPMIGAGAVTYGLAAAALGLGGQWVGVARRLLPAAARRRRALARNSQAG